MNIERQKTDAISDAVEYDCGDHDWEDVSRIGDAERSLQCTLCSAHKTEPFELNAERWSNE